MLARTAEVAITVSEPNTRPLTVIGNMANDKRSDNAHHGRDRIGDVVLRKRYSQVADDERLEQAHAVDENRVARGHDDKARRR